MRQVTSLLSQVMTNVHTGDKLGLPYEVGERAVSGLRCSFVFVRNRKA